MKRSIVIDTSLLVLLAADTVSCAHVGKHKRLHDYMEEDWDVRLQLISNCQILVTPNTRTDASNLTSQFGDPDCAQMREALRGIVNVTEERYVPSRVAVAREEFLWLGLTDASLNYRMVM